MQLYVFSYHYSILKIGRPSADAQFVNDKSLPL
jgi:hypothetical protein